MRCPRFRDAAVLISHGFLLLSSLATAAPVPAPGPLPNPSSSNSTAFASPPLPYDPICTVTNGGSIVPLRPLPPGTQRMVRRLAQIRETAKPESMAYLNDRIIPILQSRITTNTPIAQEVSLRFQLGRQFVLAGQPLEGLREFETLRAAITRAGAELEPQHESLLRLERAVALLRLGEQENCLTNHTSDSCLIPIQPRGVHQATRGSRAAIQVLNHQLRLAPGDLRARWLLNIAHMTLGEWPHAVPQPWLIPPQTFASDYDIGRFPDVASAAGLDVDDLAGGCILDDFDNDGLIDVVASAWGLDGQLRYFHNDGNGHFTERTAEAGLTGLVSGLNIQQTDYNNDGWLDIWVLRGGWLGTAGRIPNSLLRNNRDGTFTDVTEEAGLDTPHPTQASTWFDFDGDGWLDLFIGNETWSAKDPDPCELFRNNRDGSFTNVARESGVQLVALVKGVTSGDYDNDGRPDLYVSCRDQANRLLRNEGPAGTNAQGRVIWRFRDTSAAAGVDEVVQSFPTWFFDYDNDGWEDIFVSGYLIRGVADVAADYLGQRHAAAKPRLYRNLGNGSFTNVTAQTGLDRVCHTMGCNFGDLDNDGWLDFYLATGDPDLATLIPNRMFRNDRGRRFQEVTYSGGFGHIQKGHAVGFADLDNDGDQDVYTVMGGAFTGDRYRNALFLNPGHGNHRLRLHCVGTKSNRAAIGTRIRVTIATPEGPRTLHRTVNSGGSFGSSPLMQDIGLGNATAILAVELTWPASGLRQSIKNLQLNRTYRIREDDPSPTPLNPPRFEFPTQPRHTHPQLSLSPP
jgi:hypothetical protein